MLTEKAGPHGLLLHVWRGRTNSMLRLKEYLCRAVIEVPFFTSC